MSTETRLPFEEIQQRAGALLAAAYRRDRGAMLVLIGDLTLEDARTLSGLTAEMYADTMRAIAAQAGVTDAAVLAGLEGHLLGLAAEPERSG